MKKIIIICMLLVSIIASTSVSLAQSLVVQVNGEPVDFDSAPFISGNDVMIPIKQVSEKLGYKVEWDNKNRTAWVHGNMFHVEIPIGKSEFYIHRDADFSGIPQTVKLQAPIQIVKGRTFLPAEAFTSNINLNMTWDKESGILSVTSGISGMPRLEEPIAYTVVTEDELKSDKDLYDWYLSVYKTEGINYRIKGSDTYIVVSAGEKPTGGYSIKVNDATLIRKSQLYINASLVSPSPDAIVTEALTYPCAIIKITQAGITSVDGKIDGVSNTDTNKK